MKTKTSESSKKNDINLGHDHAHGNTEHKEWIGSGNSGDVYRIGNEVEKNSTNDEAKVYAALNGFIGTAKGYEINGKIRLPIYPQVISTDTVSRDDRVTKAEIVRPNIERINNAISALTRTGYEYNDPLQFGVNLDGTMDLLDFSIATNNFPKDVFTSNFSRLSGFYRQFGLKEIGDAVAHVNEVVHNQHARIESPFLYEFFSDEFDDVNYRALEDTLGGKRAQYAYYSIEEKPVDLPDIAQTDFMKGVRVILSMRQLTALEVADWNLVNVYAETDNTACMNNGARHADDDDNELSQGSSL